MTFGPSNSFGFFLIQNQYFSKDQETFLQQITKINADISRTVNVREIALFDLAEIPTGQQWFNTANVQIKRDGFRKVFTFGAIAPGATSTIAHGITGFSTLTFTHIYGTAITSAATFNQRPLPYVDVTNVTNQISIDADATNFRIVNGATAPNVLSGIVVLEYLKN